MKSSVTGVMIGIMRLLSMILVAFFVGSVVGFGADNMIVPALGGVLLGTHTGATSYTGSIDGPIARLLIFADSTTALSTVTGAKLTLTQSTPRKNDTMIPEMTLGNLADIAGYIDAIYYQLTAGFAIKFSIPISSGDCYDTEGGTITYTLSNCASADTIKVYSIDDPKRSFDYINIVPIACLAGSIKILDVASTAYAFVDPTNVTRVKVNYRNGISCEYVGEELMEIFRVLNPVNKVTDAFLLTPGYEVIGGINVIDAVSMEFNLASNGTVYLVKYLLSK